MFLRIRFMRPFPLGHYSAMTRWIQVGPYVLLVPCAAALRPGPDPAVSERVRSQLHERFDPT